MGREAVVQAAHQVGVGPLLGPVDAQRTGHTAQALVVLGGRGRHGPQDAGIGGHHHLRGADAGEQGDLGVVALHGKGGAEDQPVAARRPLPAAAPSAVMADGLDLLLGSGQGHARTGGLALLAQAPDLLQQARQPHRDRGGQGVRLRAVQVVLDLGVGQAGPRAHQGALDAGLDHLAVPVQVDGPQAGGAVLVLQERGGPVGEDLGMQGRGGVGGVDGLPAAAQLGVQGAAGGDEGGQGGDGVVDPVGRARRGGLVLSGAGGRLRQPLQEDCLVQVHGSGRVDGHQGELAGVAGALGQEPLGAAVGPAPGGLGGLGQGVVGEGLRDAVLGAQGVQGGDDSGGRGGVGTQAGASHGLNIPSGAGGGPQGCCLDPGGRSGPWGAGRGSGIRRAGGEGGPRGRSAPPRRAGRHCPAPPASSGALWPGPARWPRRSPRHWAGCLVGARSRPPPG